MISIDPFCLSLPAANPKVRKIQTNILNSPKVPEGRQNVAHHGSGGCRRAKHSSPVGAAKWIPSLPPTLCRPYGAYVLAAAHDSHHCRGGLRSAVPYGTITGLSR